MDPITGFLINLIIGVILSAASTLLKQAFGSDKKDSGGSRGTAQVGGKVNQSFLMGTIAQPGKLEYPNEHGDADGVPNIYAVDVHSFGVLPITGIIGMFINGVRAEIPASGAGPMGYPVAIPDDGGVPHFWWKFYNGSQTLADAYLTTAFGSDPDRPWLSDMVGRGVPYLITTARQNESLWTGTPKIMAELQGIKLYDITKDSTKGGSGAQRWAGVIPTPAEQATWAFSDNNAVMIYNIERGIYYDSKKVWGGSATGVQLPYDVWAAAINACNLAISLVGGGTEKQFRAGRRISLNERPADVIKELLIGSNSRISHASDGTVYILVGVPAVADGAFSDLDVLATEPLGSIPFPNLDSIINGATATYREPEQAWEDKETAPHYRSDLKALDDGREQVEGLDLGTTFSGTQAQRVIKAVIEEGRRFKTHVVALPPEFALYRPLQVLAWTATRFGYIGKLFLITARTRDPFGNVVFGLQEVDPTDHNWVPGTDEKPLNFSPVVPNRPTPQEVSGFYVEPAIALDSEDRPRRPAIDAFWATASVAVDVRAVRITVRLDGDDDIVWEGEAPRPELGSARLTEALLPDEDYEVQIQYVPRSGRVTVESSWLTVTTPDVRLTSLDVQLDDLAEEIEADTIAKLDWAVYNTRETIEEKRKAILLNVAGAAGDFMDRQTIRREASSTYQTSKAQWSEDILVATGPSSALSLRLEELGALVEDPETGLAVTVDIVSLLSAEINDTETGLEAIGNSILSITSSVPGASATGLLRVYTAATESGAQSTIALTTAASAIGDARTAALFLSSISDGTSTVAVVADRFSVKTSPIGTKYGIFVIDSGVVWIDEARIRNLDAANIDVVALTGSSGFFDLFEATWAQIETAVVTNFVAESANIGTLTIGTLNIIGDAIADDVEDTLTGSATSAETKIVYSTTWVGTGKLTPIFVKMAATVSGAGTGPMIYVVNLQNVTDGTLTPFLSGAPDYLQSHIFSGTGIVKTISGKTYRLKLQGEYQPNDHAWTYVWDAAVINRKR